MTQKKAEELLLSWGFKEFPARKQEGIQAIKSFGLKYCGCCKRGSAIVDFHNDGEDWFFFEQESGMSGSDPLECIPHFIKELQEYGILSKRKPKTA